MQEPQNSFESFYQYHQARIDQVFDRGGSKEEERISACLAFMGIAPTLEDQAIFKSKSLVDQRNIIQRAYYRQRLVYDPNNLPDEKGESGIKLSDLLDKAYDFLYRINERALFYQPLQEEPQEPFNEDTVSKDD